MLSKKINDIALSGTMEIAAKTIEMQSEGIDVLNLCVGEPDLPTPEHIKEAARNAITENKTRYTLNVGIVELRKAICKKFLSEYNASYDVSEVIVSNGAKQSVYNAIQSIVSENDEVIIPAPYYVSYPRMIELTGGVPIFTKTKLENSFKITVEEFEKNITPKTKALILCNPNNPTGAVYKREELLAIVELAFEKNIIIISDEIYEKLIYDNSEFTSVSSFDKKYRNNLIIINGVSKAYSMTGWRIGYAVSSKEIVTGMNKLQSHSTSNASTISQYAALAALTGSQELVEVQRNIFEERRNLIKKKLSEIDLLTYIEPAGAFYLFVNIENILRNSKTINTSREFCIILLNEGHVATVPGSVFGMEGYLRLSYSKSKEELTEAIKRIKEVVDKII